MRSDTPERTHRTVIVADDNAEMRALLRRLIEPLANVRECADGAQAVALYDALRPDGVLMDIRMGVMDGIEATLRIRRIDPNALVIVVTDARDASVLQAARRAGACEVVSKEDLLGMPVLLGKLFTPEAGPCGPAAAG